METTYRLPTGEECLHRLLGLVLLGQIGEPFGWILYLPGLTQLKAFEEHMQRTERLSLCGKDRREIAHEIKNRWHAMSGAVQMIQGEYGRDDFRSA